MSETQPQENSRVIPMTVNDLILMQLRDFKDEFRESRKDLSERMGRLEKRQDKLEEKIDTVRKELNDRCDKLDAKIDALDKKLGDKIDSMAKHGQIITVSTIGIALGVLYSIFFK